MKGHVGPPRSGFAYPVFRDFLGFLGSETPLGCLWGRFGLITGSKEVASALEELDSTVQACSATERSACAS